MVKTAVRFSLSIIRLACKSALTPPRELEPRTVVCPNRSMTRAMTSPSLLWLTNVTRRPVRV